MTSKADQKERTHEEILASAARLLRERGIAGARVADVMEGAGLTVGGFYAHFKSKEALIEEAFRMTARELRARLLTGLDDKPAADRAEVILKRYVARANCDTVSTGCPLPSVVGEIGTTAPEYSRMLADELEEVARGLHPHVPKDGPVHPRLVALGLVALMYGGLSLARAVRGMDLSDDILRSTRALGRAALQTCARERGDR
jgi:TetR/AcrR family transcriptional regulator, transcriptional repressor for nem operon